MTETLKCPRCDAPIIVPPGVRFRRKFCSPECANKRPWTVKDMNQLCRLYKDGVKVKDIACQLGRSEGTCQYKIWTLRQSGSLTAYHNKPLTPWSTADYRSLREDYNHGIGLVQLAADRGMSVSAIGRALARLRARKMISKRYA